MGFLGCSLYTSTIIAAIFGIILSIYGVSWTGFLLAFFRGDTSSNNFIKPFELISINNSTDTRVTMDIITTSLVIHVLWFVTSSLLIPANKICIQTIAKIWITMTAVIVITDASGTGYFIYKAVQALPPADNNTSIKDLMQDTAFLPYIIIAALFSKLGTILLFVLIAQMVYVWKRIQEMTEQKNFFMKNQRYSYSSTDSVPSHTADPQRVIYSSREIMPPAYISNSLNGKRRNVSSLSNPLYKYPTGLTTDRNTSLKPSYVYDNFGFAVPHLPHVGMHHAPERMIEPEIDYEDRRVSSNISRDYRY